VFNHNPVQDTDTKHHRIPNLTCESVETATER
jgi:hypothetical protein